MPAPIIAQVKVGGLFGIGKKTISPHVTLSGKEFFAGDEMVINVKTDFSSEATSGCGAEYTCIAY